MSVYMSDSSGTKIPKAVCVAGTRVTYSRRTANTGCNQLRFCPNFLTNQLIALFESNNSLTFRQPLYG